MLDLRAWLRRVPKPRKLRLLVGDDERIVDLGEGRPRWAEVEATIRANGASRVECLDEKEAILRSVQLDDFESPGANSEESSGKAEERRSTAQAAMLDNYGKRMNEAFLAGAKAAAVSQDTLVNLVDSLTGHLSLAITNLHNVSVNLANVVSAAAGAEGGDKNDALLHMIGSMIGMKNLPAAESPKGKHNGAKAP